MPTVRAMRLLHQIESGTIANGAALQTLLAADPVKVADLRALLASPGTSARLCRNPAAVQTLIGAALALPLVLPNVFALEQIIATPAALTAMTDSGSAMSLIANNPVALNMLLASNAAMTAVANANAALAAIFGVMTARTALYDSAQASAIVLASANARAYMVSIAQTSTVQGTAHQSANTGRTILVQQRSVSSSFLSHAGASADTYSTNSTALIDRFVKVSNLTHRAAGSSSYSVVTYLDMD